MNIIAKHRVKFILLLVVVILTFLLVSFPQLNGLLYPGHNIKIHFNLSINNKDIPLDDGKITLIRNGKHYNLTQKNGNFSTNGKEYWEYHFRITIDSDDIPNIGSDIVINLRYINANNWYISNSDCNLILETNSQGALSGKSIVNIKYNDGSTSKYDQVINTKNNEININWGL